MHSEELLFVNSFLSRFILGHCIALLWPEGSNSALTENVMLEDFKSAIFSSC